VRCAPRAFARSPARASWQEGATDAIDAIDAIMGSVSEPEIPAPERREQLLDVLAEYVAQGGAAPLLAPPVVPGEAAFPDPWEPTLRGLETLLRRLAWHAGQPRAIVVVDERLGAPPTQRKPETHVELIAVRPGELELTSWFVGEDDVAGTLAHELGVAHAVLVRSGDRDPYRAPEPPQLEVDPEHDLERGSIATVYLGLGVLAANAAFQQYSSPGRFNGAYTPLEYDVLRAGYVPMSELAYLLAVQAVVRGEPEPPPGLAPPQRDEVTAWIDALRGRAGALRERLGIAADARGEARPEAVPFEDAAREQARRRRIAFRWQTHRASEGVITGAILAAATSLYAMPHGLVVFALGGALVGLSVGRALRIARCSTCATAIALAAAACHRCSATMYGDIARRSDRLEAEDRVLGSDGS
jgi:hypothetical protein